MQEQIESIDAVTSVVDRITIYGRFADFELSNGIVLTLRPVPPLLFTSLNKKFAPPSPPKVWIEEKSREEENPNDPEYLKTLTLLEAAHAQAINDMVLGMGTSIKFIPEGMYKVEDEGWIDFLNQAQEITGGEPIEIAKDGVKRYLQWLHFYALESQSDLIFATTLPLHVGGIREGEVEEVLDSFRSVPRRGSDTEGTVESRSENGNSANGLDRRSRARDRGA